jgi:hypothetical protein
VSPNIANLSPAVGPVAIPVTINGSNFGSTQGSSTVTFNGVSTIPTTWSDTAITAPVPAGATSGSVVVTVAGFASNAATFSVSNKLAITFINNGSSPTAGTAFPVTIQSQDYNGNPANVSTATGISLSLKTGTGTLAGTLTGAIAAGTSQVTISGVTYTKAEAGVVVTGTQTSGDTLTAGDSSAFSVTPGVPSSLVFAAQPGAATAGSTIAGPPTITIQDSLGNVVSSSTAPITLSIGSNPSGATLGGTTTKNAASGIASFNDLSLDKAGSGYTLTASATGLVPVTSATFNVTAAAATKLAFSTQPTNTTAGDPLPGPPTVVVQDSLGNTVTTANSLITISIGTNPAGAVLSGTIAVNASAGSASFGDLSIDKAGDGYTLVASANGLVSTTSGIFSITPRGGVIMGSVTRSSDGSPVPGATVEAFQGTALVASATASGSGAYSISGLPTGIYTVRASFAGFIPQIRNQVTITAPATTIVNLALSQGIAIHVPTPGSTVTDSSVLVIGQFDPSLGPSLSIGVNSYRALRYDDEFAVVIPVTASTTSVTATVTNPAGIVLGADTIPIAVEVASDGSTLRFEASPNNGETPLVVTFILTNPNPITSVMLDANGDGVVDFTGATLDGVSMSFTEPGLYYPRISVTDNTGNVRTADTAIRAISPSWASNGANDLFGDNHGEYIMLKWEDTDEAAQYYVYSAMSPEGPWTLSFSLGDNLGGAKQDYTPDARLRDICYKVEATDLVGVVIRLYEPICVRKYVD